MALAKKMDLTKGVIPIQIIKFMTPLALTFVTQNLFHVADVIVVGRFAQNAEHAVAAVGSPGPVVNILSTLFMGMSAGVSVIVSQYMGAKDYKNVSRAIHSSIALALGCGIFILTAGLLLGRTAMEALKVPGEVLEDALSYYYVVLWGMPALLIYAFGCSILRSVGKPNLPMIFLTISGVFNVLLNMLLVIVFKLDVLGVAYSTLAAKILSLILVLGSLYKAHGAYRFFFGKLFHIDFSILWKVLYNGFPAGLQNSCYSIANLLVAHANFAFGSGAVAATTIIGFAVSGIVNSIAGAQYQTAINFIGQNVGAKKGKRVLKGLYWNLTFALFLGLFIGIPIYFSLDSWLSWCIKNPSKEVVEFSHVRAALQVLPGFLFMVLDVLSGTLRGMGYSIIPTSISIFGICVFRVLWVFFVFPLFPKNYWLLIMNFPLSYSITILALAVTLWIVMPKFLKSLLRQKAPLGVLPAK